MAKLFQYQYSSFFQDLHRTGCSWFCEFETPEERAVLKRVLLAYARWNKAVGYCQGFNVIAALILQVMDRSEEDALKVNIYPNLKTVFHVDQFYRAQLNMQVIQLL